MTKFICSKCLQPIFYNDASRAWEHEVAEDMVDHAISSRRRIED